MNHKVHIFRITVIVALFAVVVGGGTLWHWFHSVPTEAEIRRLLAEADAVEVVMQESSKPLRWVRLDDPARWKAWADQLHFKQRYWELSNAPLRSLVFQMLQGKDRRGVFDFRGDGCLHVRKKGGWYRMPVDPTLERTLEALLEKDGADL